jgi:hypothetical protein
MKQRRNTGQRYVTKVGKVRAERIMKNGCGKACSFKCIDKFSEDERQKLFYGFWQLGEVTKTKNFKPKYAVRKLTNVEQ